jgi:hypothetical protein
MKRLLVILSVIFITSCETESLDPLLREQINNPTSGSGSGEATIQGRWRYATYEMEVITTTTGGSGTSNVSETISINDVQGANVDFNPDGTLNQAGALEIAESTDGDPPTNRTLDLTGSRGSYILSGTVLSTNIFNDLLGSTADPSGLIIRVTTLSSSSLNLSFSGSNSTMSGTENIETMFSGTATFTRR